MDTGSTDRREKSSTNTTSNQVLDVEQELKGNDTLELQNRIKAGGQDLEQLAHSARGNLATELALAAFSRKHQDAHAEAIPSHENAPPSYEDSQKHAPPSYEDSRKHADPRQRNEQIKAETGKLPTAIQPPSYSSLSL